MADIGLFILRLVAGGTMLLSHGWGKLQNFSTLVEHFPDPIGLGPSISLALAVFAEVFCAFAIVIGLATRFAAGPLVILMTVAVFLIHSADPWAKKELAFMYWGVFGALILTGPGKFSVDGLLGKVRKK